jgi:hypothetical protein
VTDADPLLISHGIDGAWLAAALGERAMGTEAELVATEARLIGTGQVGENVRITLTWSGPGADRAPRSVVVKLPSTSEVSRTTAAATRTYVREVGFYRDLRPQVDIRTPAPFVITEDRAANHFVLVMEDITPSRAGDQLSGCTPDEAALAVTECARLHGSTWGRDDLLALDWLDTPSDPGIEDRVALYRAVFDGFAARYADRLTPAELDLGRWLDEHLGDLLRVERGTRCCVHGDFRLDNLLFGTGPAAPPLTTVDWQTIGYGHGVNDVAYFLSAGLAPEVRRHHEGDLLERYRTTLGGYGIDPSAEEIRWGYRLGSASGYVMAVIASQIVEQTDRGDQMFVTMARGAAELMTDVDLASASL